MGQPAPLMRAMVIARPGGALQLSSVPRPEPGPGEVLVKVRACAVCRTDLHIVDGELRDGRYPLVPGHQIVGTVLACGAADAGEPVPGADSRGLSDPIAPGARVGIPWLGQTCGRCRFCMAGDENLCDEAAFTGYQRPGGFAEYVVASSRFCFPLPEGYEDTQVAPLLCGGLIGYRALRMAGDARSIGFYGFGSAAHMLTQVAVWEGREVFAFTRPGDTASQDFARSLGAVWAGDSTSAPPRALDAAVLFAPEGRLIPEALAHVRKGGSVICAGIHMSDIPAFPYRLLWGERRVQSVANLTREDGRRLLALAPRVPVRTEVTTYRLDALGAALQDLRNGRIQGTAVVVPEPPGREAAVSPGRSTW